MSPQVDDVIIEAAVLASRSSTPHTPRPGTAGSSRPSSAGDARPSTAGAAIVPAEAVARFGALASLVTGSDSDEGEEAGGDNGDVPDVVPEWDAIAEERRMVDAGIKVVHKEMFSPVSAARRPSIALGGELPDRPSSEHPTQRPSAGECVCVCLVVGAGMLLLHLTPAALVMPQVPRQGDQRQQVRAWAGGARCSWSGMMCQQPWTVVKDWAMVIVAWMRQCASLLWYTCGWSCVVLCCGVF